MRRCSTFGLGEADGVAFGLGEADGVAGPGPVGLAGAAPSTKAAQLERVSRAEPASINAESLAGKKELEDELALTQC